MGNEMYHYGVLGMRWGVRRTARQLRRAHRQRTKEKAEAQKAREEELTRRAEHDRRLANEKSALSTMTDEELIAKRNRLNLEKDVQRLLNDLDEDPYTKAISKRIDMIKKEQEYFNLVNPTPKSKGFVDQGKKFLADVLPSVGKTVATAAVTAGITKATTKSMVGLTKDTVNSLGLENDDANKKFIMNLIKNKK